MSLFLLKLLSSVASTFSDASLQNPGSIASWLKLYVRHFYGQSKFLLAKLYGPSLKKSQKNLMGGKNQFVRKSLSLIQSEHRLDISKSFTLKIDARFSRNRLHLHCKQSKQLETLHSIYRSLSAALNLDKDSHNAAHPRLNYCGFQSAV